METFSLIFKVFQEVIPESLLTDMVYLLFVTACVSLMLIMLSITGLFAELVSLVSRVHKVQEVKTESSLSKSLKSWWSSRVSKST